MYIPRTIEISNIEISNIFIEISIIFIEYIYRNIDYIYRNIDYIYRIYLSKYRLYLSNIFENRIESLGKITIAHFHIETEVGQNQCDTIEQILTFEKRPIPNLPTYIIMAELSHLPIFFQKNHNYLQQKNKQGSIFV
jgi:hypothetical protein